MITIVEDKDWNTFVRNELYVNDERSENFYQLFESEINKSDYKLEFFCGKYGGFSDVKQWFFFYKVDGIIVGQISLQRSPQENDLIWLSSLSIDPKYKNMGIGKKLVNKLMNWIKDNNYRLLSSSYEPEGLLYLKHILRREAKRINIKFYDKKDDWSSHYIEHYNGKSIEIYN